MMIRKKKKLKIYFLISLYGYIEKTTTNEEIIRFHINIINLNIKIFTN